MILEEFLATTVWLSSFVFSLAGGERMKSLISAAFLAVSALAISAQADMIYRGDYDGRSWYVDNSYPDYHMALADAKAFGGTLATIRSYDEQLWVRANVSNMPAWLGYSRSNSLSSDWKWADGWSGDFTYWAPGNPCNGWDYDSSYVVAMMNSSGDGAWITGGYPSTYGYVAIVTTSTPEPASLLLLGAAGLALIRRKR
jgi:hypothetical protein